MPSQPSFCNPATRKRFIGDIFAETGLAEMAARDLEYLFGQPRRAIAFETCDTKARERNVVNLAQVVIEALDFHPLRVGRNHAPAGEIVESGSP